jgi:hypothetical protein
VDVFVDGRFEGFARAADFDLGGGFVGVEEEAQELVLEFGVEDRDADAFVGELVGVAAGEALNESVTTASVGV